MCEERRRLGQQMRRQDKSESESKSSRSEGQNTFLSTLPKLGLAALIAWGAAGCGPIASSIRMGEAREALKQARASEAQKHAIYPYVSAQSYLSKAEEENSYAGYAASQRYAQRALELAWEARARAEVAVRAVTPVGELIEDGTVFQKDASSLDQNESNKQ